MKDSRGIPIAKRGRGRPKLSPLDPRDKDAAFIRFGVCIVDTKLARVGWEMLRDAGRLNGTQQVVQIPISKIREAVRAAMPEVLRGFSQIHIHRARRENYEALDRARHEAVYDPAYFYPFEYEGNEKRRRRYPQTTRVRQNGQTAQQAAKSHRKNRSTYLREKLTNAVLEWHSGRLPAAIRQAFIEGLTVDCDEFRRLICPRHQSDAAREAILAEARARRLERGFLSA